MSADSLHSTGLFEQLLGNAFASLPPTVRAAHTVQSQLRLTGSASVERGTNLWSRGIARLVGFPAASPAVAVTVHMQQQEGCELWQRRFGTQRFSSRLSAGAEGSQRLLVERFGPLRFHMALVASDHKLHWVLRGGTLWGVRLPRFLVPKGDTYEYEAHGCFHFHVEVLLPLVGLIVRYQGWLKPAP